MRKLFLASVVLLIAVPSALAAPLKDEIDNGGFESFANGSPEAWTVLGGNVGQSSNAAEGTYGAVLTSPPNGAFAGLRQAVPNDEDDLPIVAGGHYELDFAAQLALGARSTADAEAVVRWFDALGNLVREDAFDLAAASDYVAYAIVLQAPVPEAGELPVTSADVSFTIELPSANSRHDALLFLDAVAFGPVPPPLPPLPA